MSEQSEIKRAVVVVMLQVGLSALALLFHGGGATTAAPKTKPWTRSDYRNAVVGTITRNRSEEAERIP